MESLPVPPVPAIPQIREVVCMFCLWSWLTGSTREVAAKCPRCGLKDGVEVFVAVVPGEKGSWVVRPKMKFTM